MKWRSSNTAHSRLFWFLSAIMCFTSATANAQTVSVSVLPDTIIQGDPIFVSVDGVKNTSDISKITFAGSSVKFFSYQSKPSALIPVDLNKKPGQYEIAVILKGGQKIIKVINVMEREKIEAPLGIPEKLGGNTPQAASNVVSSLTKENAILNNLWTGLKVFWTQKFVPPLPEMTVTDDYGYSRQTGSYLIAHKGTDFRAKEGTPVRAMNRGVVRLTRNSTIYGKTIVVDHGLGLMTLYMHLSKIKVNEGELVLPGQIIGLSGQTGYAESPHLHISVKMNGVSIDPAVFLKFFQ